jgi:hypothetical protein
LDIPYFVVGAGGISLQAPPTGIGAQKIENPVPPGLSKNTVTYGNGDENFGFVRVGASSSQLKVTFVRALGNHRQEFETVTMDPASQVRCSRSEFFDDLQAEGHELRLSRK